MPRARARPRHPLLAWWPLAAALLFSAVVLWRMWPRGPATGPDGAPHAPAAPAPAVAAPVEPEPAPPAAAPAHEGGALWGRVLDPRGSPVAGAVLWIHPLREELVAPDDPDDSFERRWSTRGVQVQADTRGRYDTDLLDAGTWLLCAAAAGTDWMPVARELRLADGDDRELDVRLALPALLRGHVDNSLGTPARGVSVQVVEVGLAPAVRRSFDLRTDPSGDFTLRVAPDVELLVRSLGATGNAYASILVPAGQLEVRLDLERGEVR